MVMTRHMWVCVAGLGAAVLGALPLGVPWGNILPIAAILACPAAMFLGMRRMPAHRGEGKGVGRTHSVPDRFGGHDARET
jgi:hypothetical protein